MLQRVRTQSKVRPIHALLCELSVPLCSSLCILTVALRTSYTNTEEASRWISGILVGVFDHPPFSVGLLIHHQALQNRCSIQSVCVCTVTMRMSLMNNLYAVILHDSTILAYYQTHTHTHTVRFHYISKRVSTQTVQGDFNLNL